jgi:hypothetical protein
MKNHATKSAAQISATPINFAIFQHPGWVKLGILFLL